MLTLLTPTGDRPDAFRLCERWIRQQTVQPDKWIVVDDGFTPTQCTCNQVVVRRERKVAEPKHTLPLNVLAGLERYAGGDLAIIEDDDYYDHRYLEELVQMLGTDDLVGVMLTVYYNIHFRSFKAFTNRKHASFCQTAMSERVIPTLKQVASNIHDPYIDLALWKKYAGKKHLRESKQSVGVKGMPGRFGIGIGHSAYDFTFDHDLTMFRDLFGVNAAHYAPYLGEPSHPLPGVRRLADGTFYIPRPSPALQEKMDKEMIRVDTNRWRVKVIASDISVLRGLHSGETAHVIGKGPSLDNIETLTGGPVFCINESVHKIESLRLQNKVYCLQQDSELQEACLPRTATMLLGTQCRHLYLRYPNKMIYDPAKFGCTAATLTALIAIEFAKLTGCTTIRLYGFDACTIGDTSYAGSIGHQPEGEPKRFRAYKDMIAEACSGTKWAWVL